MNWSSAQEFFAMGGYALYVWGAYLGTTVCIVAEVWWLRRRSRTLSRRVGLKAEPSSWQP